MIESMYKRKKILIIHSSLGGGGAEKVLIEILANFDYKNYDIDLFIMKKEGIYINSIPHSVNILDVKIRKFPSWCSRLLILTNLYGLYLKNKVRHYLKNKHYDTVISFMEGPPAKCHSYILDKGDKNITWVHTDLYSNHWSKLFFPKRNEELFFYRKVNEIVFVSDTAKSNFNKLFRFSKGKVIYNLIDRDAIRNKACLIKFEKDKFTLCNVGRLTNIKRQDRIIEVASILKKMDYDVDFWILGEGELKQKLKEQDKTLGVESMVHFYGFQENPYAYIKAADVFLLTSDNEGFPLVVAEALCLSKPVISTPITGPTEQLDNGNYGILTTFDVENIANAIKQLIDKPALLKEYENKADYRGREFFDVKRTMQQIYETI